MPIDTISVETADLLFDPENPRLPDDEEKTQPAMFSFIVREIGVTDLVDSIAASGVIEGDPIIVRKVDAPPARSSEANGRQQYFVIEGNRRLSALKLLNGDKLEADEGGDDGPTIPPMSDVVKNSIRQVNVQVGWDHDKLEAYLGYKHVTSTREWLPEAKARFVVNRCNGDFSLDNLDKFARRLGTKVPTLRRWLVALLTLKQAEKLEVFHPDQAFAKRYFGSFYTLLGSKEVQTFLGLSGSLSESPVPEDKIGNLSDFIDWTIGTKKSRPFVNSRSQKHLDAVLSSPSALRHLRLRRNLEGALLYTEFNSEEIALKLETASYSIEECLPKLFDVKEQPRVRAAIAQLDSAYEKLKVNSRKDASTAR